MDEDDAFTCFLAVKLGKSIEEIDKFPISSVLLLKQYFDEVNKAQALLAQQNQGKQMEQDLMRDL